MLCQRFPIWWLVPRQGVESDQDWNVNLMGNDENRGDLGEVHIVLEGTCWKVLQQSPWLHCPVLPSRNWVLNLLRWCGICTFFVTWLSSKLKSGLSTRALLPFFGLAPACKWWCRDQTSTHNTRQCLHNMHMMTVHGVCQIHPEKNYSPDFFFFFKMAHDKVFRKHCKGLCTYVDHRVYKYTFGSEQDASSPTEFSSQFEHPLSCNFIRA